MKLSFENVSKNYGRIRALSDFTLELEPGIYAILGPNGAGKSTLMNIITDNLKADGGAVFYEDENTPRENALSLGVRFRSLLGYMPQYPALYGNFTVGGFLWYMAALKGLASDKKGRMKKKAVAEEIKKILLDVDLWKAQNQRIRTLSGGMKQRLGLAQALLGDPSIILLDEPTAGLDPKQRIRVRNLISKMALNKIVLIATHVVSDIEVIAKKVIFLKRGEVVAFDSPAVLAGSIAGKVWNIPAEEKEVEKIGERYRVTGIARGEGQDSFVLRVLSDSIPEKATAAFPTLEDYYLYIFDEETALI